jgi:integrase
MDEPQKSNKARTRGNGRGSVRKLPSGSYRWEIRLDAQYHNGTKPTKTEAEKELSRVITDHARNVLAHPDKITVAEYAGQWLKGLSHLAANTKRMYNHDMRHALEFIGDLRLTQVRATDLKKMFDKLATKEAKRGGRAKDQGTGRTLHPSTLAKIRTHIRALFSEAVRDQIIYVNPADAVRPIKAKRGEFAKVGTALDFDQAARLHELGEALYSAGAARLWTALFLCASLGLRRGEVMGLRWCDVDLENAVLRVRQNLITPHGSPEISTSLKTDGSERDIPLPPSALFVLERHKKAMQTEALERGEAWRLDSPVQATQLGTYTHPDNLERAINSLLKWSNPDNLPRLKRSVNREHHAALEAVIMAGEALPKIRLHDLRHTAGTLMLRRGMRVEVVSKILGHAKVSITLDVYRHVLESEKRTEMVDLFPNPVPTRAAQFMPLN